MRCPRCHTNWPDELAGVLKFCGACGAPLTEFASGSATSSVSEPGGELRFVTVLFADLADSTTFTEERAPDEAARIIGDLLQRLGQAVEQHGGTVDKFMGDAVLATFGLPRPDPDAARNAVRAGLALQEVMRGFCAEQGLDFHLRVGIHAGEVMFRMMGQTWTVMGDTVNTASRIQNVTPPGKVWLSQTVYDQVRRFFILITRSAVELKGKKQAVQPYEVVAERSSPLLPRPLFVGRESEWGQIQMALEQARDQRTMHLVVVRGPAGVGKSRLVSEFRDWLIKQPDLFRLDVVQYDHSVHIPAHGLSTLLRRRFGLTLDLSEDEVIQRLAERLREEDPFVEPGRAELAAEFFTFMLGILRPGFRIHGMDGHSRWEGAFIELKQWLEGWALQRPWVVILEDVQGGDPETAAFVDWALQTKWSAPVLIIATLREEDFTADKLWHDPVARWVKLPGVSELRLRELDPTDLARALMTMAEGAIDRESARWIAEHTEGNPLFATEVVLFLREHGLLSHNLGAQAINLPASIRQVMEARLERLGMDGKDAAKRGALIGRRFGHEALERIWDRPPVALSNALEVLKTTETVYEEESLFFSDELEYVFRHGRLREVALARIPREERLKWLQTLQSWAKNKLVELGDHWEGGAPGLVSLIARSLDEHGANAEASYWHELLGLLHRKHNRNGEAIEALRQTLTTARGVREMVLKRQLAQLLDLVGEFESAVELIQSPSHPGESAPAPSLVRERVGSLLTDSLERWDQADTGPTEIALELVRAEILTHLGRVEEARAVYEKLEPQVALLSGESGVRLVLRWGCAWIYLLIELLDDLERAEQVCCTMRACGGDWPPAERLAFLYAEATLAECRKQYERANALLAQELELLKNHPDPLAEVKLWMLKGNIHAASGEIKDALSAYQACLATSRAFGLRRGEALVLHNLGLVYFNLAEWQAARSCQEQYLALSRLIGNHLAEAYAPLAMAAIALEQDEHEQAALLIGHARQVAETNHWPRLIVDTNATETAWRLRRAIDHADQETLMQVLAGLDREQSDDFYQEREEVYGLQVKACLMIGQPERAAALYARACEHPEKASPIQRAWLDVAEAALTGQSIEPARTWFRERGFQRALLLTDRIFPRIPHV